MKKNRIHNFRELKFWQKSRELNKSIYLLTNSFPKEENYGLTQQIRRSSISISSNIAEGCGRGTDPQLIHFLNVALSSAFELESQLYLSLDLEYVSNQDFTSILERINEVQRMIRGFINSIQKINV